jgi:hypothetical protein
VTLTAEQRAMLVALREHGPTRWYNVPAEKRDIVQAIRDGWVAGHIDAHGWTRLEITEAGNAALTEDAP